MNLSGTAEFDDGPIVTWTTASFCFPAVAHVCRAAGHDQVVTVTEKHIATGEYEAAVFDRGEIDVATNAFELFPIRYDFTVDTQPRDAAVREDLETQVRDVFVVLDRKRVLRVAAEWHLRQERDPGHCVTRQLLFGGECGKCD